MKMTAIQPESWKEDYRQFEQATEQFYSGEMDAKTYKGISGGFGSYAQKGGKASMLRLRMPGGVMTKEKLAFVVQSIKEYEVKRVHLTTCQTLQLHDLSKDQVCELAVKALSCGIVTRGGGGDFPRNVMVSPLAGVEEGEYFDVLPYALKAADYLMSFIKGKKLPRKLKVGFSNTPKNVTHATYRDLGFAAREDGTFDVYSAGGLGNKPAFGVRVAEGVAPDQILYYIRAMHELFCAYGNYENRAKARSRFMQEALGGAEAYKEALKKVLEVTSSEKAVCSCSRFEESVACIGASICQQGVRDSQALLHRLIEMEREEGFEDGILPQIHISGCPSSCGTHQTGVIGFRGGVKSVNKEVKPAFNLFVKGCCFQGKERMGEELGAILEENIPAFLKALGHAVQESGLDFEGWYAKDAEGIRKIAENFLA